MAAARDLAGVTVAILAGGLGTRLRPVVADRPKVLAPVAGRPFLAYLLDQVAAAGLRDVVLCIGHLGEQVWATFGEARGRVRLAYAQESAPLGTAGALRLALPLLTSETVLVLNGDSYCAVDLGAFWAWQGRCPSNAALVLTKVSDTARYGQVHVNAAGRVASFAEKGSEGGPGWINAGIYLLPRAWLGTIPAKRSVSLEREMFPAWLDGGVYGYRSRGQFLDIGTPDSYARAAHILPAASV